MQRISLLARLMVWLSVLVAAVLQIIPLPPFFDVIRPNWMFLVSMYWCMALPHRYNIGSAFAHGLLLDLIWGTTLGINGLVFALCISIIIKQFQKIRSYSVWHQALTMALLTMIYLAVYYFLESMINDVVMTDLYYLSALGSLLFWPWIFFILRKTRRHWAVK
ncbi:MAG: rod shape-determining protein MreD [Psychrobium sp.]|nr:rod shape-determining protein MreD [Psychrobium sp.]